MVLPVEGQVIPGRPVSCARSCSFGLQLWSHTEKAVVSYRKGCGLRQKRLRMAHTAVLSAPQTCSRITCTYTHKLLFAALAARSWKRVGPAAAVMGAMR
eukprot:scaffold314957_cov22-Tisochrysis_lutea.AAC.1